MTPNNIFDNMHILVLVIIFGMIVRFFFQAYQAYREERLKEIDEKELNNYIVDPIAIKYLVDGEIGRNQLYSSIFAGVITKVIFLERDVTEKLIFRLDKTNRLINSRTYDSVEGFDEDITPIDAFILKEIVFRDSNSLTLKEIISLPDPSEEAIDAIKTLLINELYQRGMLEGEDVRYTNEGARIRSDVSHYVKSDMIHFTDLEVALDEENALAKIYLAINFGTYKLSKLDFQYLYEILYNPKK